MVGSDMWRSRCARKVGRASHSTHFIGVPEGFLVYANSNVHI